MKYIRAVFEAAVSGVWTSAKRVASHFVTCAKEAFKRPAVLPFAAALAVGAGFLSPFFAGGMVAVVVNDPEGHPIVRMAWDIVAVSIAMSFVVFVPWVGILLAAIPIASLANRFLDSVDRRLASYEAEETEECRWQQLFDSAVLPTLVRS